MEPRETTLTNAILEKNKSPTNIFWDLNKNQYYAR